MDEPQPTYAFENHSGEVRMLTEEEIWHVMQRRGQSRDFRWPQTFEAVTKLRELQGSTGPQNVQPSGDDQSNPK